MDRKSKTSCQHRKHHTLSTSCHCMFSSFVTTVCNHLIAYTLGGTCITSNVECFLAVIQVMFTCVGWMVVMMKMNVLNKVRSGCLVLPRVSFVCVCEPSFTTADSLCFRVYRSHIPWMLCSCPGSKGFGSGDENIKCAFQAQATFGNLLNGLIIHQSI